MLGKSVNDNSVRQVASGVCASFASELAPTRDLERHLAEDHVAVHHKIPQQAVKRVLKGGRAVLFEEEVAYPGKL